MAGHQKVFVVCENKCFEEGMTKEQILDLTSKASSGVVDPVTGDTYKVRVMSKEEYDDLTAKDNDTIYYVYDEDVVTDIAMYASEDKSKGTIEERLTALGFKEGTFNVGGVSASGGFINEIKKRGKYVIANLNMVANGNFNNATITVPSEFIPKENTGVAIVGYVNGLPVYNSGAIDTNGILSGVVNNATMLIILNAGWETN